jgi:photosystem II stability/assembly factor-like uncharacterized protein
MKNMRLLCLSALVFIVFFQPELKAQSIVSLPQGPKTSIRGLSVVNDNTAWISGSKGYIGITTNGGKVWAWSQVKGFERSDFRDIEAFSAKEAVIMSSGTPAVVLKTTDGGVNWKAKYTNPDSAYFFDAMDFSDHQHGYILGDPIHNKILLMETKDAGNTWHPFKNAPDALTGEASFAASGTCLRANKNRITIVTGGGASRELAFVSDTWLQTPLPFPHQKQSQGAFSVASNGKTEVFVGGDYANDKRTDSVACFITYERATPTLTFPQSGPAGFQSCVEYVSGGIFLSTGTLGTNITTNGGQNWTKIDDTSYNVCRRAKHGKLVILAGNGGKIGILKL